MVTDYTFSYYKPYLKGWGLDYTAFEVLVGASSQDIRLTGNVELACPDMIPPQVTGMTPRDSVSIATHRVDLVMTFDKPVRFNNEKQIVIREYASDVIAGIIPASSVGGSGTGMITFYNTTDLALHTKYYITVDSAAFLDQCESAWEGISDKDAWTFVITSIGYEDRDNTEVWLHLYPNPAKDVLVIEYHEISISQPTLQILDFAGRVVATVRLLPGPSGLFEFDCSGLGRGVYYVKLVTEKGGVVKKFVKGY